MRLKRNRSKLRKNVAKERRYGEARFTGKKYPDGIYSDPSDKNKKLCKFPDSLYAKLFVEKALTYIGGVRQLNCESPVEPDFDARHLIMTDEEIRMSEQELDELDEGHGLAAGPLLAATKDGKCVVIMRSDKIYDKKISLDNPKVKEAKEQYVAFHGVEPEDVKAINIEAPEKLYFVGNLNHIVYSVPVGSQREGVPFIHEGKDRGDDVPPAQEKPLVCYSSNKDFLVMYGPQFEFTERGLIG
jgi:hypothetical protein